MMDIDDEMRIKKKCIPLPKRPNLKKKKDKKEKKSETV